MRGEWEEGESLPVNRPRATPGASTKQPENVKTILNGRNECALSASSMREMGNSAKRTGIKGEDMITASLVKIS